MPGDNLPLVVSPQRQVLLDCIVKHPLAVGMFLPHIAFVLSNGINSERKIEVVVRQVPA